MIGLRLEAVKIIKTEVASSWEFVPERCIS